MGVQEFNNFVINWIFYLIEFNNQYTSDYITSQFDNVAVIEVFSLRNTLQHYD